MESRLRSVTEHVERVVALVAPLPVVSLGLADAEGQVLAEDLHAAVSVPPFDSAAMDGYAVRLADLPADGAPVTLQVTGDVAAGADPVAAIGPRQAARIMTGAPLPPGADAVVPVEHTSTGRFVAGAPRAESSVTLARRPRPHVRPAGEDVREGQLLAAAGTVVTAAVLGAVAASGAVHVPVRRRPRVAVISTGSELVPVGRVLGPGQITDSNGPMLAAGARAAGADVVRLGPVPDDPSALRAALDAAVRAGRGVDLIVTAGGVSAGAADVVREVLAAASSGSGGGTSEREDGTFEPEGKTPGGGVPEPEGETPEPRSGAAATDVDVAAVALSPGKPQALARWRGVPWLALPGNPVGAYASFELFVRPAIGRLRGERTPGQDRLAEVCCSASTASTESNTPRGATLSAAVDWSGSPGRLLVVPVRLVPLPDSATAATGGTVSTAGGSMATGTDAAAGEFGVTGTDAAAGRFGVEPCGSRHALSALAVADGVALVPPDVEKVRAGDLVRVLMLR